MEEEVDSPALTPAPTHEPLQEESKVEEDVEVVELEDEEEEEVIQEDESAPAMGWTTKFYYKPRCESSISHHRLKGILQTYYANWDVAMEYVCNEHTHPLEDTYWKTRVCISI